LPPVVVRRRGRSGFVAAKAKGVETFRDSVSELVDGRALK
jgi:hypothetical protein